MKKSIYWLVLLLMMLGLGLYGCADSLRESKGEELCDIDSTQENEVSVVLNLDIPFSNDAHNDLRAITAADEKKIESLRVLMFKVEGNPATETFAYEAPLMRYDNEKATVLLKTSENGEKYRAVLIANNGASGSSTITVGKSKAEVLSQFTFDAQGKWNAASSENYTLLPMWGESDPRVIVGAPIVNPYETIKIYRAVARVDVGLCLSGTQFDETANPSNTSGVTDFILSKVYVHNANTKGYVAKLNTSILEPSIPNEVVQNTNILEYPVSKALSLREIYLAEAANGANLPYAERPFLVIEGMYKGKKTFYRIDYLKQEVDSSGKVTYKYLPLLRNYRYKINITKIGGKGFDTQEEAAQYTAANIEYNVTVWNESAVTKVVYDGEYMLGVSEDNLTYYNHAHTKNITVRTSWPEGWTATVTKGGDWIHIQPNAGDANKDVTMGISVEANEKDDAVEREGIVTITAGRMTWEVKVKQLPVGEVALEIYEYDADGTTLKREPISILNFTGKGGTKKIAVKYSPSNAIDITENSSAAEGYSGPINLKLQDFKFEKLEDQSTPGIAVYNVKVEAMNKPDDYFESITDVGTFTIKSEGKTVSKALVLQQTEYNAIPYETFDFEQVIQFVEKTTGSEQSITHEGSIPFFLMDGKSGDNFVIKANTRYDIKMKSTSNRPQVKTADNQGLKLIESGFPENDGALHKRGKFAGETLGFTTANDLKAPKRFLGYVEFEITSPDGLFEPRTFKLLLASGIMQPEANTYLMKPGYIGIIIPVSQIDKAAEYYNSFEADFKTYINQKKTGKKDWEKDFKLPKLNRNEPWSVEVLWAEVMNTYSGGPVVSGNDPNKGVLYILTEAGKDYIFVMPSYNYTGNVIIGLKQGGKIMWSWHLWLVDTYPSEKPLKNIGSTNQMDIWKKVYPNGAPADMKWLDRDLGAFGVTTGEEFVNTQFEQHGLVYQWGRKDPFPLLKVKNESLMPNKRRTKLIDKDGKDYFSEFSNRNNHLRVRGSMKDMINNPTVYYSAHEMVNDVGVSDLNYEAVSPFLELPNSSTSSTDGSPNPINRAYTALWGGESQKFKNDEDFIRLSTPTKKTPFDPSPYGWKVPNGGSEVNWGKYRAKISTIGSGIAGFYKQHSAVGIFFPNMSEGDAEAFRWHSTRRTDNVKGRYCSGTGDFVGETANVAWSTSAGMMVRSVRNEKETDYEEYLPNIKVKP